MKYIPLTQGQVAIVDDEDYEYLNQWKWYALWQRNIKNFYAVRKQRVNGKRVMIFMHRLIMRAKPGEQVDHINHITLDNRKCNLRICNRYENMHNSRKPINNSTGFKGVSFDRKIKKFKTQICVLGRSVYLGAYDNILDAAIAYDQAALKYFGDFAYPNLKWQKVSGNWKLVKPICVNE